MRDMRGFKQPVRVLDDDEPLDLLGPAANRAAAAAVDDLVRRNPRCRRARVEYLGGRIVVLGALHWSDGTDLDTLPSDAHGSPAYRGALFTEPRSLICLSCGSGLRGLVVDAAQALFTDMTERLRDHTFQDRCPVCASPLNAGVVEYLDHEIPERL